MNRKELENLLKNHKHLLSNADLRGADLTGADLAYADLTYADLTGAVLTDAYLTDANLRHADLTDAVLRRSDLAYTDLRDADLRDADLTDADLTDADLKGADLRGADLRGVNLRGVDLRGADLTGAKNVPFIPFVCPDFGSFIGFKKAKDKVVALEIPEDAKRCSATTRKCRCNKAKVLGIYDINHNLLNDTIVASNRDNNFLYIVGETVTVDNFDEDRWNECSTGIHFFINFEEAARY